MGTPYSEVFDCLMASIEEDDWARVTTESDMEILNQDLTMLLNRATQNFLFPRIDLDARDNDTMEFENDLTYNEIYVLAILMKYEWVKRCVASWRVIKQQYHDSDFQKNSEANHLAKLVVYQKTVKEECKTTTNNYARRKYNYTTLTGGKAVQDPLDPYTGDPIVEEEV